MRRRPSAARSASCLPAGRVIVRGMTCWSTILVETLQTRGLIRVRDRAGSPVPRPLGGRPWPDIASQHLPDLDRARARRDDRIVRGEGPQLLLIVGLHDAETPGAGGVEHGAEDHHLARLNPGPPVLRVAPHDLALLIAHVQREGRTGRFEAEYEDAHELRMPSIQGAAVASALSTQARRAARGAAPVCRAATRPSRSTSRVGMACASNRWDTCGETSTFTLTRLTPPARARASCPR